MQDEKYGNIPIDYFCYRSSDNALSKRAKVDLGKTFDSYYKTKKYDKILEEKAKKIGRKIRKEDLEKERDEKVKEIFSDTKEVISEYGEMNQYRAIYDSRMPNCDEEDISNEIINLLNTKKIGESKNE